MVIKKYTFTDYNGNEREETYRFSYSESEIANMELRKQGGLEEYIKSIIETHDNEKIMDTFEEIMLKAYGEKSADGLRFIKKDETTGRPLYEKFRETPGYDMLFMEMIEGGDVAIADFIKGVLPTKLVSSKTDSIPMIPSK